MKKGYTLIEIVLAVTILASISLLSVIFYSNFFIQHNVLNIQDQLYSALQKAHTYSLVSKNSSTSGWGVHYESINKKFVVFQGSTYAGRNTALDETYKVNGAITISGITDITFSRITGKPSPAGPITITITGNSSNSKQIFINKEGVISK